MVGPDEFPKYDCMTPTTLDYLADYDDALHPMDMIIESGTNNYALLYTVGDEDNEPSATEGQTFGRRPQAWISYPNNVLAYDMNRPAGTAYYHKPRGSWKVKK
ncbi:MAG: hypothetical protein ACKPKO_14020, partial [Candidatus Fonsibacter sp.]